MTRHSRPRPVHRQRQLLRRTGQHPTPVLHLRRQQALRVRLLPQQLPLPQRIIRVLHRQRLPHRTLTPHPRRIRHRHVPGQRTTRPTITRDVVHDHQQNPLRAGLEQPRPDRQLHRQIEGVPRRLPHGLRQLLGRRHLSDLEFPVDLLWAEDLLVRLSVHGREERPQRLVPLDHITQRSPESSDVHTAKPDGHRHVVRRARPLQLRQEPQPPLRERQRHPLRTRPRPQRRTSPARTVLGETPRQPGHRRRLEQRPDLDLDPQHHTNPRHQPHRQQRMPTEVEEAVVNPHRLQPQHLGERRAQDLFLRRGRASTATGDVLRCGQGTPVQLPVGGQRQFRQRDEGGRDHVLRQPRRDQLPQPVDLLLHWHHVGHQPPVTHRILTGHDRHLRDVRMRQQHGLDLTGLDPEAAHLHLLVRPAQEHQLAIAGPLHQVPGPVHPLATGTVRTRNKPLTRQRRTPHIPARHPGTSHIQLTRNPHRHRLKRLVQHEQAGVGDRRTDRHHVSVRRQFDRGHANRGLRRPVVVEHPPATGSSRLHQLPHPANARRLTTKHQRPRRQQRLDTDRGRQGSQMRRHHLERIDPLLGEILRHRLRISHRPRVQHMQLPTRGQTGEHHRVPQVRHLRLKKRILRPRQRPAQPHRHRRDIVGQRTVRDRHTLRHTRRPRRIDHIRQPRRLDRHPGRRRTRITVQDHTGHRIVDRHHPHPPHRQVIQRVLSPQHHLRTTVGQHVSQPLDGQLGVDRQIGRARLPHRQNRRDHLHATRQAQAHQRLAPHTHVTQVAGQPIDLRPKSAVRQLDALGDHRHRIRSRSHPPLEQLHHRRRRPRLHRGVVPLPQHPAPLRCVKHLHRAQPHIRSRRHNLKHPAEPPREPVRRRRVEQVRRHRHRTAQPRRTPLGVMRLPQ
ncbi:hypothetical protein SNL152K_10709 [Streptomyces sp. NL15-2K]|nr:hypothetical protein SNL152K_10709 [Streptomyces sp. NL15-2K]